MILCYLFCFCFLSFFSVLTKSSYIGIWISPRIKKSVYFIQQIFFNIIPFLVNTLNSVININNTDWTLYKENFKWKLIEQGRKHYFSSKCFFFMFNTLISVSLPWVKIPLKLLFWYDVKLYCCISFNFLNMFQITDILVHSHLSNIDIY